MFVRANDAAGITTCFEALFTVSLAALPGTPTVFMLAVLGENAFQSAAFGVESTIIVKTIGEANPLAATQYPQLAAAPTFSITYMQAVDGAAYGMGGLLAPTSPMRYSVWLRVESWHWHFGFVRKPEPQLAPAQRNLAL